MEAASGTKQNQGAAGERPSPAYADVAHAKGVTVARPYTGGDPRPYALGLVMVDYLVFSREPPSPVNDLSNSASGIRRRPNPGSMMKTASP